VGGGRFGTDPSSSQRAVRAVRVGRIGTGSGTGAAVGAASAAKTAPGLRASLVGCHPTELGIVYRGDYGFLSMG
jgi:hypothetical protein